MKKIFYACHVLLFLQPFTTTTAHPISNLTVSSSVNAGPRATFEKLWVDNDVYDDAQKGMRIHVRFSVFNMKDQDTYLVIYFRDSENRPLKDKNKKFCSPSGQVALYKNLRPGFEEAVYSDLSVFMPYEELDLGTGAYDLQMAVDLTDGAGVLIQPLTVHGFIYSGNSQNTEPIPSGSTSLKVAYKTIWVDYDIIENGRKGMMIHLQFDVFNMMDIDSYVAIYFSKKDGAKLITKNSRYSSEDGQVALFKSVRPGYNETSYSDLALFMPYQEFNLTPGTHDLIMEVNLIYKNGAIISPLTFYSFLYEKM